MPDILKAGKNHIFLIIVSKGMLHEQKHFQPELKCIGLFYICVFEHSGHDTVKKYCAPIRIREILSDECDQDISQYSHQISTFSKIERKYQCEFNLALDSEPAGTLGLFGLKKY